MAIEDQRYQEAVKAINLLIATGRTSMVRGWLVGLAVDILKHYGYEVVLDQTPPMPPASCPTVRKPD
jgi:hypothetical protein